MYLYDGSFDIQMLNYCHPNCLSHFKPVKFDLCVQIEQIQTATAYLLFSFFRNFILLYCNLFELDNLRVPGTIWQNNFLLIFWSKRVCRELHSNKMEEFTLYLFYFRSCKELNSKKTLYWKRGTVYEENWLCFLIRNFNHS